MTRHVSTLPADQFSDTSGDSGTLVLGPDSQTPVRCAARWIDDRHAYVVAPLATATAVHQRWEACALLTDRGQSIPRERRLLVELISADTLGSDSGKEGLLLRYSEKPGPTPRSDLDRIRYS